MHTTRAQKLNEELRGCGCFIKSRGPESNVWDVFTNDPWTFIGTVTIENQKIVNYTGQLENIVYIDE